MTTSVVEVLGHVITDVLLWLYEVSGVPDWASGGLDMAHRGFPEWIGRTSPVVALDANPAVARFLALATTMVAVVRDAGTAGIVQRPAVMPGGPGLVRARGRGHARRCVHRRSSSRPSSSAFPPSPALGRFARSGGH